MPAIAPTCPLTCVPAVLCCCEQLELRVCPKGGAGQAKPESQQFQAQVVLQLAHWMAVTGQGIKEEITRGLGGTLFSDAGQGVKGWITHGLSNLPWLQHQLELAFVRPPSWRHLLALSFVGAAWLGALACCIAARSTP